MFRPIEIFVGLRYTRAKRRNHFISFISLISMLGITLGIAALITVLSVMNGFEKELRHRILGVVAHATVTGYGGELRNWPAIAEQVAGYSAVTGVAPFIQGEGMFSHGGRVSGTLIRGVLPDREGHVSEIAEKMVQGKLSDLRAGDYGIVLGEALARSLSVTVGDKVTLITPQASVTPAGIIPRMKRFTVVGTFEVGMYEYDSALALLYLDDAATLLRMSDSVSGLRIKVDDLFKAPALARQLQTSLGMDYRVSDWTREHVNFFRAVQTEKTVMFIILLLIVAVAAFNIVSTLVMVVTDKRSDIAILRTLGASPATIMGIFMVQGIVIGAAGTLLGIIAGVALALNVGTVVHALEQLMHTQFLAPDVYYISDLPSDLRWFDVAKIAIVSFIMAVMATLYPAWRASRTQPAEALRYE
jgi:lipoprotein-releasing system permease protein